MRVGGHSRQRKQAQMHGGGGGRSPSWDPQNALWPECRLCGGKVAVNSWEEEKVVGVVCGRRDVLGCYASYFVKEEGMNRGRMSKDT